MSLRPLGHRILVKPDTQPENTDSGLILQTTREYVPMSGTVAELGPGGHQLRYRTRQRAIQDCLEMLESTARMFGPLAALQVARENVSGLLGTTEPEREIQVGDRVAFPREVGLRLVEDGVEYVILNEEDVAVLVMEEAA